MSTYSRDENDRINNDDDDDEEEEEDDDDDEGDDEKDSERLVELVLTDTVRIPLVRDTVGGSSGGSEIGCKLWTAAVMLNGALRSNPEIVHDKKVLEIGAGLGACGLCSAVLGASSTTICDCGPESLMALSQTLAAYSQVVDSDEYDKTATSPATVATTIPTTKVTTKWDDLNVSLRRHLWEEDLEFLEARDEGRPMDTIRHWSKNGGGGSGSQDDEAPMLPFEETFDVVLGSDLLYFSSQERPLLAVLQLRLRAPNGVALILQTMRTNNVSVFQRFVDAAHILFDVTIRDVAPDELCRLGEQQHVNETPHTTGYKLVTITVKKD
jgi:predicted nicotinamide N-methyase